MELRPLAVAAPDIARGRAGELSLVSSDPASLFNACRLAGQLAQDRRGAWGQVESWRTRRQRHQRAVLLRSLDDLPLFERLLDTERPNLLLIGCMALSFPGAIACASRAREVLGDGVCTVLGGPHIAETMYTDAAGVIRHHPGSPLRLVHEGRLPPVFDFVIAGEAEHLIPDLGGRCAAATSVQEGIGRIRGSQDITRVPGDWLLGWSGPGGPEVLRSAGRPLDLDSLPSPCSVFGISAEFPIFPGAVTGHVFSEMRGCAFDCEFCSERRSSRGGLRGVQAGADRLYRQLSDAVACIRADHPGRAASAFVEDSLLLGGLPGPLSRLAGLLAHAPLPLRFGGQLSVDQVAGNEPILRELHTHGLDYLFIGVETFDPTLVTGMHKDIRRSLGQWHVRAERAIERLAGIGIRTGAALLFGLGESQASRLRLLDAVEQWRRRCGQPCVVGANWGVQHPLKGMDGGTGYRYLDWGTPPGELHDLLLEFGEASVRYPLAGREPPQLQDVREIHGRLRALGSPAPQVIVRARAALPPGVAHD